MAALRPALFVLLAAAASAQQSPAAAVVVVGAPQEHESVKAAVRAHQLPAVVRAHQPPAAKQPSAAKQEQRSTGRLDVNGPLPRDFAQFFSSAVAQATGVAAADVVVTGSQPLANLLQLKGRRKDKQLVAAANMLQTQVRGEIDEITFEAPRDIVQDVEDQAGDAESPLATGALQSFLVDKEEDKSAAPAPPATASGGSVVVTMRPASTVHSLGAGPPQTGDKAELTPIHEDGRVDIDTAMPYGELEPFGREDTAQELTEQSIVESDEMVDQLERAEVAEEKRAVFRALTRLRGAAITSFDGVARSQTGNIDEYNKLNKWRRTHPLHHLADEESDIKKWAFPDNADFAQLLKAANATKANGTKVSVAKANVTKAKK